MNQVKWYIEKKAILIRLTSDIDIDELAKINNQIVQLLVDGDSPVHVIYHSDDVSTPRDISKVAKTLTFLRHDNCGWIISIGLDPVIKFVSRIVANLSHINFKTVDSIEEVDDVLTKLG